jgi:hypothetical protein
MKILLLFFDMIRTDHIKLYNPDAKEFAFDAFFSKIGGTLYTHCYSPAPDTPRSMSCLWSGMLPYKNKCDVRIKWPRYFMEESIHTIFDNVYNRGYDLHLCANENYQQTGLFKIQQSTKPHFYSNPQDFINGIKFTKDLCCFIANPDSHFVVNDYEVPESSFKVTSALMQNYFDNFITPEFIDQFDYTFFFSDHGMQTLKERVLSTDKLDLLNDGRTNLLMFCHKKGDIGVKIDTRLCSNIDLYATVEKLSGGEDVRDGYSLLEAPARKALHIEDHTDFSVSPEVMIKQWRVITDDLDIRTNLFRTIDRDGNDCDLNLILPYLQQVSPKIIELQKQYDVWKYYKKFYAPKKTFWVGEKRMNQQRAKLNRFASRLLYILKYRGSISKLRS